MRFLYIKAGYVGLKATVGVALALFMTGEANAQIVGYGGTDGGAGGPVVRASTGTQIHQALCNRSSSSSPVIIEVSGTITPSNTSKVSGDSCNTADNVIEIKEVSNVTIRGSGRAVFDEIGIHIRDSSNIIIQNVHVRDVKKSGGTTSNGGDAIGMEKDVRNVWIDHCTLEAFGGENEGYDGLLDMKNNTQYVTISYNRFRNSGRGGLVGSSESDQNNYITYHHNWWENINTRTPLFRYGTGHIFNNFYDGINETGINVRAGGRALVQGNYFVDSRNPLGTFYTDTNGTWEVSGNIFSNVEWQSSSSQRPAGPNVRSTGSVNVPYSYRVDQASCVPSIVRSTAGANTGMRRSSGNCSNPAEPDPEPAPEPDPEPAPEPDPIDPDPSPGGPTTRIQENASGFCGVDGSVDNNNGNFTGNGFANTENANGQGVTWSITGPSGAYTLRWRYANGSTANRSGQVLVNGSNFSTEDFPGTGGWESWTTTSVTLNLSGGTKTVRLVANQGSGLANIDYLEVSGPGVVTPSSCGGPNPDPEPAPEPDPEPAPEPEPAPAPSPNPTIRIQENSPGFCGVNGSVDNNNGGFSGDGFANTDNTNGASVGWSISGQSGSYTFRWQYANGTSDNRSGNVRINGSNVRTQNFSGTGGWDSWNNTGAVTLNLGSGTKRVTLTANQGSGLANIDYLEVTGPGVGTASDCSDFNNSTPEPNPEPSPSPSGRGSSCTSSQGNVRVSSTIQVNGTFDGGCKTYTPTWGDCTQGEGQDPVFRVNGGTLKNVIVGPRGDGIHVYGNATITNIHWPNVCEDALTIKSSANVTISNITARDAADKVFQSNARSTVVVRNAIITNAGKVLRENGGRCYPVNWTIENSSISNVKEAVFRSDCSSSRFALRNVDLSGVPEVCYSKGKYASCNVN
ncbi:MAG: pectate lyase [Myxococcales bacterium]|nr:pectate lyase [Myxococcales bacterium]